MSQRTGSLDIITSTTSSTPISPATSSLCVARGCSGYEAWDPQSEDTERTRRSKAGIEESIAAGPGDGEFDRAQRCSTTLPSCIFIPEMFRDYKLY